MKIGYPCINRSIGCTANQTFRLASYSEEKLIETVQKNLNCLKKILDFNIQHNLLFFRIGSPLIPFASHPICQFNWQTHFKKQLLEIGLFIKKNKIRISMHPDQFTLINAIKKEIVQRSIAELKYHCDLLDSMELDATAKIQIHIGGVYGDKESAKKRFIQNYKKLPEKIKKRLAIENDHRHYSLKDCLDISQKTGLPIIFDFFHHQCLNNGENLSEAMKNVSETWKIKDGSPMTDYSSQKKNALKGSHAESINLKDFQKVLREVKNFDFDIMLEIKDKEKSALKVARNSD